MINHGMKAFAAGKFPAGEQNWPGESRRELPLSDPRDGAPAQPPQLSPPGAEGASEHAANWETLHCPARARGQEGSPRRGPAPNGAPTGSTKNREVLIEPRHRGRAGGSDSRIDFTARRDGDRSALARDFPVNTDADSKNAHPPGARDSLCSASLVLPSEKHHPRGASEGLGLKIVGDVSLTRTGLPDDFSVNIIIPPVIKHP